MGINTSSDKNNVISPKLKQKNLQENPQTLSTITEENKKIKQNITYEPPIMLIGSPGGIEQSLIKPNSPIINKQLKENELLDENKNNNILNNNNQIQVNIDNIKEEQKQINLPLQWTVFVWKYGGQSVYLCGSFTNNWKDKLLMKHQPNGDWTISLQLSPGIHTFKYIVDGIWKTDPQENMVTDNQGNVNNSREIFITTSTSPTSSLGSKDIFSIIEPPPSPPGEYTKELTNISTIQKKENKSNSSNSPPSLPPHLQHAILNTKCIANDPMMLPLPHHVMLNHLYTWPKRDDQLVILGITQRYREKFITTVYYQPLIE